MRLLKHRRFGRLYGFFRSLHKKRYSRIKLLQNQLMQNNGTNPCVICDKDNFELVSQSDRYGFRFDKKLCKNCGLLQTNPMPSKNFFNMFYDKHYRELYRGTRKVDIPITLAAQNERGVAIYNFIKSEINIKGFEVFEIGCSYGGVLDVFKAEGHITYGCDLDTEAVKKARENHSTVLVSELPTTKASAATLYILSHVLEHIPDPLTFLSQLYSLMSEEDVLYVEVPGINLLLSGSYQGDLLRFFHIGHVLEFTKNTLINTLKNSGLEALSCDDTCRGVFKKSEYKLQPLTNFYDATRQQLLEIETAYHKRG